MIKCSLQLGNSPASNLSTRLGWGNWNLIGVDYRSLISKAVMIKWAVVREDILYKWVETIIQLLQMFGLTNRAKSHTFLINGYHLIHSVSSKEKNQNGPTSSHKRNWNWGYWFIGTFDHAPAVFISCFSYTLKNGLLIFIPQTKAKPCSSVPLGCNEKERGDVKSCVKQRIACSVIWAVQWSAFFIERC